MPGPPDDVAVLLAPNGCRWPSSVVAHTDGRLARCRRQRVRSTAFERGLARAILLWGEARRGPSRTPSARRSPPGGNQL